MISGRSGLAKFMLSVMASGSAPTAVRLRHVSTTACLVPIVGIGGDVAGRHIAGDGEALLRAVDAHDGGVAARAADRVAHHHVVVLLPDPAARGRAAGPPIMVLSVAEDGVRRRHPFGQDRLRRHRRRTTGARTSAPSWRASAPGRSASTLPLCVTIMRPVSVVMPMTAKSRPHFLKIGLRLGLAPGLQDHQHALLALRQHHLVGRHAGFALGHVVEVERRCRRRPCRPSPRSTR